MNQNYFQELHLSANDLDTRFNMAWGLNFQEFELRGPQQDQLKYFYARGWIGVALNVIGKYDGGKNDWLQMNNNQNQWHIMFQATQLGYVQNVLYYGPQPSIGVVYRYQKDIRNQEVIGTGVYFSNHIEVVEKYASTLQINNVSYKVVIQCRVNPKQLKQIQKPSDIQGKQGNPDWDNDYFVINRPEDIRPYRILLKEEKL